ncbi:MAG: hypothetical protein MPJ50_02885 [Pirellulales bacterium]|nr:hypothetical protein [Pirellulales bacterium]
MKRLSQVLFLVAMIALVGCGEEKTEPAAGGSTSGDVTQVSYDLCADCGQQKDTNKCCAEDAETCESCKLHKGSPGCCKMKNGQEGVAICACGHIKGDDKCCKDTADKCDKCSMFKGSPGCCKMEEPAKDKPGDTN